MRQTDTQSWHRHENSGLEVRGQGAAMGLVRTLQLVVREYVYAVLQLHQETMA